MKASTQETPESAEQVNDPRATDWSVAAALGAAVAASACCTIPLMLVSLGIGGAWIGSLTALAPYRWIFVSLAVGALVYAGFNEWQKARKSDCACETGLSPAVRRTLLGLGALAVLLLIASPWFVTPSTTATTQEVVAASGPIDEVERGTSPAPTSFQQVVLEVTGMTCASCPVTVRRALERVDGVYSVEATLDPPQAVIRFDPSRTSVRALTDATASVGFPSSQKPAS